MITFLVIIYIAWCGLLFIAQNRLIFPATLAGTPGSGPIHPRAETLELNTPEGTVLAAFIAAPRASAAEPAPTVIFLHGNAELIDTQTGIIRLYHSLGVNVLLPEYRGYGRNPGTPSQKTIVPDVIALHDQLLTRADVDPDRVMFHGRSLGGAIAAQLADQRPPRALVVESTGTSVASMAWRYGVPPFLVRSPFRTDRIFARLSAPILIFHGQQDRIFPVAHGRRLNDIAANSTLVEFDCGHNELPGVGDRAAYIDAIRIHLTDAGILAPPAD